MHASTFLALPALLAAAVSAQTAGTQATISTTVSVPAGSGAGPCSPGAVNGIQYKATSSAPLDAFFVADQTAYAAIKSANLNDPSTANLPSPVLDLSCFTGQAVSTCSAANPTNQYLPSQVLCLLFKNSGTAAVSVNVDYAWIIKPANDTNTATATNATAGATNTTAGATNTTAVNGTTTTVNGTTTTTTTAPTSTSTTGASSGASSVSAGLAVAVTVAAASLLRL